MERIMGVINLGNEKDSLGDLTKHRCQASVPFGGRYRLVDFTLSNFVKSGVRNVGVFARNYYRSLLDHLGSGKEWDLDRQKDGLFIMPYYSNESYKGDIQHFYDNLSYFERSKEEYILVTQGSIVWNIDFRHVFEEHKKQGADITLIYKDYIQEEKAVYHTLDVDENERVQAVDLEKIVNQGDNVFLNTYLMKKSLFIDLMKETYEQGNYDFFTDAIRANLESYHVQGFHFKGYMPFIHSVESFYNHSMNLLDENVLQQLFYNHGFIYTKVNHGPPAKYLQSSQVVNSLIANGCSIEGTVENSILFRGVKVHKGAIIRNSIIMQKGEIGEGALLENVILDKDVKVSKDRILKGDEIPTVFAKSSHL
ncbi:glucose-1-phosphate adenylyltransferase subunit GlgD [Halalkalibacter kiskunsagensis]|uniref:Glucose-1-phosphate adenylyltransferase subunit GlgD n=1 Tax=Halalkalibacter kiskunsagensis TaxID=1548599 RepID=A0ABV6KDF4_9BACI